MRTTSDPLSATFSALADPRRRAAVGTGMKEWMEQSFARFDKVLKALM